MPAAALLADPPVLLQARQDAVQVVLLDAHLLGHLGDRDAWARPDELERLLGACAAAARPAAPAATVGARGALAAGGPAGAAPAARGRAAALGPAGGDAVEGGG